MEKGLNKIAALSYAEIEEDGLEIKMSKARGENDDMPVSALVANIPLRSLKDRQIWK